MILLAGLTLLPALLAIFAGGMFPRRGAQPASRAAERGLAGGGG